jgi:catechol 2,3-dioxygenase-like lactoylglutathione lyase family enzyme
MAHQFSLPEGAMRGLAWFVAGAAFALAIQVPLAQSPQPAARLNHVAIAVPNVAEALTWYTDKMGFREVIRQTNAEGQLTSVYLQISRDTFLEVAQANDQRPVGLNHWGLEVPDIKTAVAAFRQRGATSTDPSAKPSAYSGGYLANITDPHNLRIELSEQPPEGKLRRATENWKP